MSIDPPSAPDDALPVTSRRRWLRRVASSAVAGPLVVGVYGRWIETRWLRLRRIELSVPNLPAPFDGTTVGFVSDTHHGPHVPIDYLHRAVRLANESRPDILALGGDYVSKSPRFIEDGVGVLAGLKYSIGSFAVLGNHDLWEDGPKTREALAAIGARDVTNVGVWLERGGRRLRIAGVGDLWTEAQDVRGALGDAGPDDATILLSHNPDFVEEIDDARVGLVLSGHTHGGQVSLPVVGSPWTPSAYGSKYRQGLVQGPTARVFIGRGVGTSGPPVRFHCRPEVVHVTLRVGPRPRSSPA